MTAASAPGTASPPRRCVVATAGHVDHGKTTLVRALTGVDTDRLPEEKRRGISIELGFAELPGTGISFIDVPGHRKLVHTMIAGMSGVELVVLVVAADDGVMPQTHEHLAIASLLGVRQVLVALTKVDLVDAETAELAELDAREAVAARGLELAGVVRTAALAGIGVAELAARLRELVAAGAGGAESARAWLAVDRVFSVKGTGTVITGTLTRGRLVVGEPVWVAHGARLVATSCRGLEVHGRAVGVVGAPARVAVNLPRLAVSDLGRGDVLTRDAELPCSARLDVALRALPDAGDALADGASVVLHLGTGRVGARVVSLGDGVAHLALERVIACEGGVGFVLRGFAATRERGLVLGGGHVLDACSGRLPPPTQGAARALRRDALVALRDGRVADALEALVRAASPRSLAAAALERRLGLEPGTVARQLTGKRARATCTPLAGGAAFVASEGLRALAEVAVARVTQHHAAAPEEPGLPLETLRAWLARRAGRDVGELCVQRLERDGRLLADRAAGWVATPDFAAAASPAARGREARVLSALSGLGLEGAPESRLALELGEPVEPLQGALQRLAAVGRARRLGGLWFAEEQLEALRSRVRDHLARSARLSVPDFKDLAGVSRKQAIPLLEQLDREGTTRRLGDDRVLGAGRRA